MLAKEKLDRINLLAKKAKNGGLTEAEKLEQKLLREEYLEAFRENFKKQLDNIEVRFVDEEGQPLEDQAAAKKATHEAIAAARGAVKEKLN